MTAKGTLWHWRRREPVECAAPHHHAAILSRLTRPLENMSLAAC
ncbi:MAG: hypothetical protein R3C42_09055 [Parvularculaceae bacterium]